MKKIPELVWTPAWTSIVGCIHGSLKYLDIAPSLSWLFGATGHGFIINMSRDGSCPSGPTAWVTSPFYDLGKNLGYEINGIFADKRKPGWEENQKKGWDLTRAALDQNLPVLGWEMAVPEWYVVNGYDETGYFHNGPGSNLGPNPKPWVEVGNSGIGLLEIYSINPVQPADDKQTIKEALVFALAFNKGPNDWVLPEYTSGLDAYQVWIDAVGSGKATLIGHAYNAAVWGECREGAAAFLREAKKRIPGVVDDEFDGAILSYTKVAKELKDITELYPFFENNREKPIGKNPKSEKAAEHLQAAKKAEEEGATYLERIIQGIN